jgi:hypothetical protein
MRHGGRPSQITDHDAELLRKLWMAGCPVKEIMRVIGLSEAAIKARAERAGLPPLYLIRRGMVERIVDQHRRQNKLSGDMETCPFGDTRNCPLLG